MIRSWARLAAATLSTLVLATLWVGLPIAIFEWPNYPAPISQGKELAADSAMGVLGLKREESMFQHGRWVGTLYSTAAVYRFASKGPSDPNIYLYAWVWRDSLNVLGPGRVAFKDAENIRIAANRSIIGRLQSGAVGRLIYINARRSWALVRLEASIGDDVLEAPRSGIFTLSPTRVTVTTSDAGELPDDITPEAGVVTMIAWFIRDHGRGLWVGLVALLVIAILWRRRLSVHLGRSRRRAPNSVGRADG